MEDAAKKRREYLRKKALMLSTLWTARILCVVGVLLAGLMVVCILVYQNYIPYGLYNKHVRSLEEGLLGTVLVLLVSVAAGLVFYFVGRDQSVRVRELPPVDQQITALPADVVLLRCSDRPAVASDELLRAARDGAEVDAEELLRANQSVGTHKPRGDNLDEAANH